jgi:hypothetical protein
MRAVLVSPASSAFQSSAPDRVTRRGRCCTCEAPCRAVLCDAYCILPESCVTDIAFEKSDVSVTHVPSESLLMDPLDR